MREEHHMARCKDCGEPIPAPDDPCPKCGLSPGPETLTDMPAPDLKGSRKQLSEEIELGRERDRAVAEAECRECGTLLTTGNICPKCGVAGGPQTITDMPKSNIREADRQLRKEIKEAREREKRQE
jgi:ribosomal protein L32